VRRFLLDLKEILLDFNLGKGFLDIRRAFLNMTRALEHKQALGELFIDLVAQRVADIFQQGAQVQMYDGCFCLGLGLVRVPCAMVSPGIFWILK
jgi:site-specific recombinase